MTLPLPSFDARGLLPPFIGNDPTTADRSPYVTDIVEFATAFGTTTKRKALITNLIAYRTLLAGGGFVDGIQFLDGSFLEDVERTVNREPGDIDVFSLLPIPSKYHGNKALWQSAGMPFWQQEIINQPLNKARFQLDTYALAHPQTSLTGIRTLFYWHGLFGHQRNTFAWKGFVAVPLDPVADQKALGVL